MSETTRFKSEVDVFTTFSSDRYSSEKYRRKIRSTVFVHQNNSDLASGLEMVGYSVIRSVSGDVINNTLQIAKNSKKSKVDIYVVDSIVMDNGELQSPFSLIGYIRVYDPYTPILALSYDTTPESVQSAFRYGATSYLPRPQRLELITSVMDGLIAAHTVATEAISIIDAERMANSACGSERVEMLKISDSFFLDYAGKRVAFLDTDGVFTFSNVLADSIVQVLHCLAINKGKRLSAIAIGRLLGEVSAGMDYSSERRIVDRISSNIASIKRIIDKYDKYKTVHLSSVRRYGTTLDVSKPDKDAVEIYKLEKSNDSGHKGDVKAGFKLLSLMEESNSVKTDKGVTLEDLL